MSSSQFAEYLRYLEGVGPYTTPLCFFMLVGFWLYVRAQGAEQLRWEKEREKERIRVTVERDRERVRCDQEREALRAELRVAVEANIELLDRRAQDREEAADEFNAHATATREVLRELTARIDRFMIGGRG